MINARSMMKPPNIIIRTDSKQIFEKIKTLLESSLEADRYTIHHSTAEKFLKASWKDSCCLLFCNLQDLMMVNPDSQNSNLIVLKSYVLNSDGRVLFFLCDGSTNPCTMKLEDLGLVEESRDIEQSTNELEIFQKRCTILKENIETITRHDLVFVLNLLGVTGTKYEDSIEPKNLLTPAVFLSLQGKEIDDVFKLKDKESKYVNGKNMTITFHDRPVDIQDSFLIDDENLPVTVTPLSAHDGFGSFDLDTFRENLITRELGQNIIFTDTITSTQTVLTSLNPDSFLCNGLVIHAKRQLRGKGRSGNQWLSPPGCMMFSMQMRVALDTPLGRSLTIVQHLVIVAFVRSIRKRGGGYNYLCLNIKWPNDIYINKKVKVGGIICNSSLWKGNFLVNIGLGVNISNKKPTDCLNSLIRSHNTEYGSDLSELSIEEALAGTLNEIEVLVKLFQIEGLDAFRKEYYNYWLHSDAEVTLENHGMEKARIIGIDDFGYLVVKLLKDGSTVILQPDGNSFDMMRNMIVLKS